VSGFAEVETPAFSCPGPVLGPLPEVSFGAVLDAVDSAIEWVFGISLRHEVTDLLVGDTQKLSQQVEEWKVLAAAADAVQANLSAGLSEIQQTWKGDAAQAMVGYFGKWLTWLTTQAETMRQISAGLDDMGRNALDMAQTVVDLVRTIIDVVSAGLANASIPFYGQWKLIESVKEAITMVYRAIQVIKVFHDLVTLVKDAVVLSYDAFTTDNVPSSAGTPAPANAA
jgi:uncharacterized protein YukE